MAHSESIEDTRSKLRLKREVTRGLVEDIDDPHSIADNIWSDTYDENIQALSQLELKLHKQKRKVYEIQRVVQQHVETTLVLLSLLHSTIEEF